MSVEYDPFSPEVMHDPYPVYRELRAAHRAYALPAYDAWALTRFDDVWQALADRRTLSIVEGPVFRREQLLRHNDGRAPTVPPARPVPSFSTLDAPVHTHLRKAMLGPFRPGFVAGLEPTVRALARDRLDELDAARPDGRFDVRHDYAAPVAAAVAAHQLGFRVEDARSLVDLVNRSVRRAPGRSGITEEGLAARREMGEFFVALVADRRARPRPAESQDALDGLLTVSVPDASVPDGSVPDGDGGLRPLDDTEIADQLSTLFVGGSETLPKVTAGAAYELWRDRSQRNALLADPTRIPHAFEEALRTELPLQFVGRTLLVDAEIAGESMRAGQRVVLLLICANRDEREFDEAERFDATRFGAGGRNDRNLGLGHGVHVCIGAHIARLEGAVMLQELLTRHPRYEVDDTDLRREGSEFHVSWAEMPVVTR